MTKTKTATLDPETERDALLDRAAAGEQVDPLDLARVDAASRLEREVAEHVARREAEAAEEARLVELDQLRLDAASLDNAATQVAVLYTAAVAALGELVDATETLTVEGQRIAHRLTVLAPLPDDAEATSYRRGRPIGAPVALGGWPLFVRTPHLPARLAAHAAAQAAGAVDPARAGRDVLAITTKAV